MIPLCVPLLHFMVFLAELRCGNQRYACGPSSLIPCTFIFIRILRAHVANTGLMVFSKIRVPTLPLIPPLVTRLLRPILSLR